MSLQAIIPDAMPVGSGRFSVMFWDLYDAELIAPQGRWSPDAPFALRLTYLCALQGESIADHSAKEIRRMGFKDEVRLAGWHTQMKTIFPDVHPRSTITGIVTDTAETIFYHNDTEIGRIQDPIFADAFFAIWLGNQTRAPDLRARLLGEK